MDDNSTDSDSDIIIMKKCLDVELPPDFNPNKVPETGEEYVQHVMYERKMCKKWVVAKNINKNELEKYQTFSVTLNENCIRAPKSMVSSDEWKLEQVVKFTEFRKLIHGSLPEIPDKELIHISHITNKIKNQIPNFAEIVRFCQNSKLKILEIILDEIDEIKPGETIAYNTSIWIFGVLSTLAIPLSPEACHILREIARKCSIIRSNLPDDSNFEIYSPLNSFICIIVIFFKQLDLDD